MGEKKPFILIRFIKFFHNLLWNEAIPLIKKSIRDFYYAINYPSLLVDGYQSMRQELIEKDSIINMQKEEIFYLRGILDEVEDCQREMDEKWKRSNEITSVHTPLVAITAPPVGRIDYLSTSGSVQESVEFWDADAFVHRIIDDEYWGEPSSIIVYSDPKTGTHINTSWILDMDPPPQGFQITPYDPVANLTAHFTREQLAEVVDQRIFRRVAIESTDDYTEPGFCQETVDIDVQNEDGSYGRVVNKYRVVTISNEGYHLVSMTGPLDSYEAATDGLQDNPTVRVVSYDELVKEAEGRRYLKDTIYDLNHYSTEQIQQAIDQLDNCPAVEAPAPSPVPEFELEI